MKRRLLGTRDWGLGIRYWVLVMLAVLLAGCTASIPNPQSPIPNIVTSVDPAAWAKVPAGDFPMGLHEHPTAVAAFEIMVTPVTNAQYGRYLNEALKAGKIKLDGVQVVGYYPGDAFNAYKHEEKIEAGNWLYVPLDDAGLRLTFDGASFTARLGYENHPMTLVSWFGAKAYCEFYGWRLPTEAQWEKAARGVDRRPFPWGHEIKLNNANFYSSRDLFEKLSGGGGTTPVGFYNGKAYDGYQTLNSASPYGLYDMAGNVWQWTADIYEGIHYRYMRGGSFMSYGYNLRVWTRNNARPDYASPSVGFRCAK